MTYTSVSFYLFLAAVLFFYYLIPLSFRWMVLFTGSIAFYFMAYKTGWWILLIQILLSYAAAMYIGYLEAKCQPFWRNIKKAVFTASLAVTVLPWFCMKNGDFILGSILHRPSVTWIVPLGISFYTLQMISYLTDIYAGKIKAQTNPAKYALFILFFPQIVQGPVPRYENLAGQLYTGHLFDKREFEKGFQRIVWGFFLKFMIADKSAVFVQAVFDHPDQYTGCYVLTAGVLYSIELYADFMACTEICKGAAGMCGIRLSDNFRCPYLAVSVSDFWRRWHISLSSWLRDYIYIPLGGSRCGKLRKYINLTVTFAASGIWHGADWTFILWGLLHGMLSCLNRMFQKTWDRLGDVTKWAVTFMIVNVLWILFRAESVASAKLFLFRLGCLSGFGIREELYACFHLQELEYLEKLPVFSYLPARVTGFHLWLFLAGAFFVVLNCRNSREKEFRPNVFIALATVVCIVWSVMSFAGISTFLYFDF